MDALAHYVILSSVGRELFVNASGADSLPLDLCWGPVAALDFIRTQDPTDHLSDDVWCQAAGLVDIERQSLLLFANGMSAVDRVAYLDLTRALWLGWTVRWAPNRLGDIVDGAGFDREGLITPFTWERAVEHEAKLVPAADFVSPVTVATLHQRSGQTEVFTSAALLVDVLARGPALVESGDARQGSNTVTIGRPMAGFHIEVETQALWYWSDDVTLGLNEALRERWPGWMVRDLGLGTTDDSLEVHVDLAEDAFRLVETDPDDALRALVDQLLIATGLDEAGEQKRAALARALAAIGKTP